ncbi:hypothetical protein [Variovorax sp. UMC13]|uniref:hypothetical protein n=1 Tax=Variovorax sp. UMC13 TaxID=1862326 RepID=UPI001602037C|nr:hypothetical protein [Variovorax sp. UMC13]
MPSALCRLTMAWPAMAAKALCIAAFGARGTGKTAWVKQQVASAKPARLLVWDFKHDPSLKVGMGKPLGSLGEVIRAMDAPAFQLRYLVDHGRDVIAQFDLFCRAAYAAGDLLMFVDELPEVTKANSAPPAWRRCVNVGREYQDGGKVKRLSIIGAGQRPAECDKTFIANCDVIHTGRLGDVADAKRFARSWGVMPEVLTNLPDLEWIEKRADSREIARGKLTFRKASAAPAKPPKG